MKRIVSTILVLAMAFALMLGVMPLAADEATPELSVSAANLEFSNAELLL